MKPSLLLYATMLLALQLPLRAQGILTVTPGPVLATTAGTGTPGYTGDGSASTAAQLARPSGIAYDAAGNLFLADANNHVIRKITPAGVITSVAGSGTAGFGGDGGPAAAAFLDTPTAVAVDANNNLFIADSHNHRIRLVSNGAITTVAGTGTSGFSGDGGPAASAQLALPTGIALDSSGNLYIADTNNHRIRKLAAGTLTTVAGNGEELFAGDGGPAAAASLDEPTGVAIDSSGTLYIADKNNHRIRTVSAAGTITTLAGNGTGAFSGDGAAATAASLAKPVSVALDPAGNVYIADTNNQRIRQISTAGTITTLAGAADEGFAGDAGPTPSAILNNPRAVLAGATGLLNIADTGNARLRTSTPGKLTFAPLPTGNTSAPQLLSLSNTGSAPLSVTSLTFTGPFSTASGTTCSAIPFTLAPGAACGESIVFQPASAESFGGSVSVSAGGAGSQVVLLAGAATVTNTTLLLAANKAATLSGESLTLTATLATPASPASSATGSIAFYAGSLLLGSVTLTQGTASFSTASLPVGAASLTAVYTGNTGYSGSTSPAFSEIVADLTLALSSAPAATVEPGHSIAIPLFLTANNATGITGNIRFSTAPLPAGLAVVFAPVTVPLSPGQLPFTMTVTAPPAGATSAATLTLPGAAVLFALLLFPTSRRRIGKLRPILLLLLGCGSLLSIGALTGCGSGTGFFGQKQQTYNITVIATATDTTGGTLTRNILVNITVQ